MTNARKLMRLHVEALFTHDESGRLLRVNEPDGAAAPRFFVGITTEGVLQRFRYDVDDDTRRELEDAHSDDLGRSIEDRKPNADRYRAILDRVTPVERVWTGPAFCFPREHTASPDVVLVTAENADILQPLLASWIPDVRLNPPMFAKVVDGHAVSVCCSVRRTSDAHEAGVETAGAYRGQGYAAQVVAAWANAVREFGLVPLYSTSWENERSQAVARKLGLTHFGSDLHIT
jgi:GNAT superfamily N-acetyltransferase